MRAVVVWSLIGVLLFVGIVFAVGQGQRPIYVSEAADGR